MVLRNDKYSPEFFQAKRANGTKIKEAMLNLYHSRGSGGKNCNETFMTGKLIPQIKLVKNSN